MNLEDLKRSLPNAATLTKILKLDEGATHQQNGIIIRCPFHEDSTPSCSVRDYENGIGVKCFGCPMTGTAFDLIAVAHGLDPATQFGRVVEIARALATTRSTTPSPSAVAKPLTIEDGAFDEYARRLLERCPLEKSPAATAYMKARGLFERAVADGWGALPDTPAEIQDVTRELGFSASRILGLETTDGLRFPLHKLLVPWRSALGLVVTLQRRVIDVTTKDQRKYIFPAERGAKEPYGVEHLRDGKPLAIVEGAMDTLAMRELCERDLVDRDVLGLPGVQNWSRAWDGYVRGRVALIAVDNDEAGDAACPKLADAMHAAGATNVVRRIPRAQKDWASLLETEVSS